MIEMTNEKTIETVRVAFANIFPALQNKRWRSGFNSKDAVLRAYKKGNPHAENIVKAMNW